MSKKLKRTLALAALMTSAAGMANATEGWYARLDVGQSIGGDVDIDAGAPVAAAFGQIDLEDDWMASTGLGYPFSNGFRLEGELSYRYNDLRPQPTADLGGNAKVGALMANLYYDFNRGGQWEPYLGVGVGAARVDLLARDGAPILATIDTEETAVAYQGMAGVAIGMTPQLDLDIGYRYFTAPGLEGTGSSFFTITTFPYEADYTHQAVTVGLRYQFAAPYVAPPPAPPPVQQPPPPPPPVAAACPTSEFVVYFEWDRSNLNAAALETIDAAVNRARQCNVGGVVVVGHTDTSGSTAYNAGLSERRASVVRDALVARGIGAGAITSQARGETDLARSTRDGVREPLNRRTAVTIRFR
jgi:outer membrane protein OmpA-like peptidoglycan-associated protein